VLSEEEALTKVIAAVSPLPSAKVPLGEALGRFSASNLAATIPLPSFDNSAMDGYAVISSDAKKGARLKIVGEQPAGVTRNLRICSGETVRIFTGAPIPTGADAVVMQEETEREGDVVVISAEKTAAGEFVRKAGGDLTIGQQILERGDQFTPARLALLASQELESAEVHKQPRLALITTGDELVRPGEGLRPGQIFESNGTMLSALAQRSGAKVTMRSHCPDNFEDLCRTVRSAAEYDAMIISGGVSVGERDLVQDALREIGAQIELWRVAVKPGKPFLFGMRQRCAIFGLPGNPVSSFVTFLIFVRPALLRMMGAKELRMPSAFARLAHDVAADETRPHYLRGKLTGVLFSLVGPQESHALFGLAQSNALLQLNPGQNLAAGSEVEVLLVNQMAATG
jgi:molybdopterin molybdotransferase